MADKKDQLMSRKEAARYISFAPSTLDDWARTKRHDLKPLKISGRVRYRKSVLDAFLAENLRPKD